MSRTRGPTPRRGIGRDAAAAVAGALAVLLTSTAFSGVFSDARWVLPMITAVGTIASAGMVARSRRWATPWVITTQAVVLLVVLTAVFSDRAILGVLPGPGTITELWTLLGTALGTVRTAVPPVSADTALQCLVFLGIGLTALLLDAIAVSLRSPAVAGLVLLCVFAVPASLSDDLLPWWTFLTGALGFVLLLMAGSRREHTGSGEREEHRFVGLGGQSLTIAGLAAVVALLAGSTFTAVGTEGRLPGSSPTADGEAGEIGIRPFTSLQGQLTRNNVVELFRVRGLPEDAYLRAMTLREFDPSSGWKLAGLTRGVPARGSLPLPPGRDPSSGSRVRIEIEPLGYRDAWLPVFGVPLRVSGMGRNWRYDPAAGVLFTQSRQESRSYVETALLPEHSPAELRRAEGPLRIDPSYLELHGVEPRITNLAARITAEADTAFDKAVALNRFFTDPGNGFVYDEQTAPVSSGSALADFLFRGKRGYCEQFASSMAVLLRAVGIPSRVAVGFTSGRRDGDSRLITTEDAHAWVEAYFPGVGWTTFDPTPLDDGRTSLPSHLTGEQPAGESQTSETPGQDSSPTDSEQAAGGDAREDLATPLPEPPLAETTDNSVWATAGLCALVVAVLVAPATVRSVRRHRRMAVVTGGAPGAATTAWREVLDEFRDRGSLPATTDTARGVAGELTERHGLDAEGVDAMRALVAAVERDWYAPAGQPVDPALPDVLRRVRDSLRRSAPLRRRQRLLPRSVLRTGRPET
ncbi:transglutaminase superfamily protein [Halopolyspora algeriensis]|uniref:Transglutaminase superfamily protein n=1 Tax=Halopolyspora algeriensis TaxID=1500506 RepID=A0A368VP60_9ACTN|nr:DUF3488 and transglutaminase-like domain-containing protein [Halopolyspora algeriensis]RCW43284.1 transglutaminase superfamily protein [Halopolyspora algeriensis]TQM56343.1 transglutaminase superfamily protein [Halopolyspora algeriensis]